MASTRWVTEMGMGVDVRGDDYTKAACRAVFDAIHHSSLNFFSAAGKQYEDMLIDVHIGVQRPDAVDVETVAAELPYGTVTVHVRTGGLDVEQARGAEHGNLITANAIICVSFAD